MYLSAKEAAERKGVTQSAIYNAFDKGLLEYQIVAGKKVTTERALLRYDPVRPEERAGRKLGKRRKKLNLQENTNQ